MLLLPTVTLLSTVGYALLFGWFARGWKRLPEFCPQPGAKNLVFVSVIIPFRNELIHLPNLIQCLAQQSYSYHHLEVLLINDGSDDGGPAWIEQQQANHPWLKLIASEGEGKKEALRTGISHSTGELIVTTDADCEFGKDWIQNITAAYLASNPDLLVAPVTMEGGTARSARFQKMDYLALQMTTAGAMGVGYPVMCSGANLAFRKSAYLLGSQFMDGKDFLSGDDVFLLHAMKKEGMKAIYVKSAGALVKTNPAPSFKAFLFQRARWGGKSRAYKDLATIGTALLVLITNLLLATLLIGALLNVHLLGFWLLGMVIKAISDWCFLRLGHDFFLVPLNVTRFIPFSLLYPFYIVVAALGGLMIPVNWKGRRTVSP